MKITDIELDELFLLANSILKESEELGAETIAPALNEFRYANEHKVRAKNATSEEQRDAELAKAKSHYIRGAYDALQIRILLSLANLKKFQTSFAKYAENEDLPSYVEAINFAKELQQHLISSSREIEKSDVYELREKANHLDILLDQLSENRSSVTKAIAKERSRFLFHVAMSISGIIITMVAFFVSQNPSKPSKNINMQINKLVSIQKSLSDLQSYVTDQKSFLQNLNKNISGLKKKKAELEQVVALDNSKIDLVLKQYDKAQEKHRWLEIFISYVVGILSSTTVTLLFGYRKKLREEPSLETITNTKGKKI